MKNPTDNIDITDAVARARELSVKLPAGKAHRMQVMRAVAASIQEKQGHFLYDQVYDVFELAYNGEAEEKIEQLAKELEEWLSSDPGAECLGEEGGFIAYRLKST